MKLLLNTTFRFSEDDLRRLRALVPDLDVVQTRTADADTLDGHEVDILVSEPVPKQLSRWPRLRWVQLISAGANQILNHPIRDTGIGVTTASGLHGVPMAQYVTCTWLMMAHRMQDQLQFKPSRTWPDRVALTGRQVRGLTAGLIGYGSIGRECARQLHGLGMRIVCLKRDPSRKADDGYNAWPETGDPQGRLPDAWYGPSQLREMLERCDLVVVTAPATHGTRGMIGKRELAAMRRDARLIIISRGGIVEEAALAEALRERQLAEAVVDCFVGEPIPPTHPFFDVPNLIMTPHMSGISDSFWPAFVSLVSENLRRFRDGQPLLNLTNHELGY